MNELIERVVRDASLNPTSRYRHVDLLKEKSGEYLDLPVHQEIPASHLDILHEVRGDEVNRLDKIAFRYYQTVELYWVIAHVNGIIDPLDVPAGTLLRVPPFESLYAQGGIL